MIRFSITFFYGLGAAMRHIEGLNSPVPFRDVALRILHAKGELEKLLNTQWFLPAVKSAFGPGQKLFEVLKQLSERDDWDSEFSPYDAYLVSSALNEFQTVLRNELAIADSYFVSRKGAYDTSTLIASAEQVFASELVNKAPSAIADLREAGKCLAFELPTAAGFHVLRGTETVIRAYWTAVANGKPHPKQKNMGAYLSKMEKHGIGNKKVRACLQQIKDLHRNPLIHPEETLALEDAIGLVGICASVIAAMLKEIPLPIGAALTQSVP